VDHFQSDPLPINAIATLHVGLVRNGAYLLICAVVLSLWVAVLAVV
jgi:hypothetical protein